MNHRQFLFIAGFLGKTCDAFRYYTVILFSTVITMFALAGNARPVKDSINFFGADHPYIRYSGRIDFTDPKLPRFWQPGVYITVRFKGSYCEIILNDENLWGKNYNYLEIVVDGKAVRLQTRSKRDTINVAENLPDGIHTLVIHKNTEANIGYLELAGIRCRQLIEPMPKPLRKIEFIGNSITCGAGSDVAAVSCGKGAWHDQHNAYASYGAITGRALKAQYHLSAVSGIGLMHSCCNMNVIMPQVFDKISMRNDTINWDFSKFQPDVVTVCLGQNDREQDSALFVEKYSAFIGQLREHYPGATIICLTSPMADQALFAFMKKIVDAVVKSRNSDGDKKIYRFYFSKQYNRGCDGHPDLSDHQMIANELIPFIKQVMKW